MHFFLLVCVKVSNQIIEAEQRFDLYVFKGETERADHV